MPGAGHRFPRAHRLSSRSEFDRVFQRGLRTTDPHFSMMARPNEAGHARLGLAVSVKNAGNGVMRNRLKRLIRESFRLQTDLPAVDIVVTVRAGAGQRPNAQLWASLANHWQLLAEKCRRS
jgi:ribonuclease P protein component